MMTAIPVLPQGKVGEFELKDIDHNLVRLSDVMGPNLTVIDFWATWCKPCLKSIPGLIELDELYEEEQVAFIGISIDSPRNQSKVRPFTKSMGVNYPVLLDPTAEVMADLLVTAIPTLLLIDSDGNVVYRHEGYHTGDERRIREEIETRLNK